MGQTSVAFAAEKTRTTKLSAWSSVVGVTFSMLLGVVVALNLLAIAMRLLQPVFPSAHTRTPQGLAMLFATGSAAGEFLALIVLWRYSAGKAIHWGGLDSGRSRRGLAGLLRWLSPPSQ